MRRAWVGLAVIAILAAGCDPGETDRLRDRMEAARSEADAARREAREAEAALEAATRKLARTRRRLARTRLDLRRTRSEVAKVVDLGRPGRGLVVALPSLGSLRWRCDDARRFSFTFAPDDATVTVHYSVDGEVTTERLHPGEELVGPFVDPGVHQEWTVTYRHEPGPISAGIFVDPSVEQGACVIRDFTMEESRA